MWTNSNLSTTDSAYFLIPAAFADVMHRQGIIPDLRQKHSPEAYAQGYETIEELRIDEALLVLCKKGKGRVPVL